MSHENLFEDRRTISSHEDLGNEITINLDGELVTFSNIKETIRFYLTQGEYGLDHSEMIVLRSLESTTQKLTLLNCAFTAPDPLSDKSALDILNKLNNFREKSGKIPLPSIAKTNGKGSNYYSRVGE